MKRALSTPSCRVLFSLDKSAVPSIRSISGNTKVVPLSDPIKHYEVSDSQIEAQKSTLGIEPTRSIFLLFGHLDDRKGIETVLDAIALLTAEENRRVALVLAGPIEEEFRQTIEAKIEAMDTDAQVINHFQTLKGADIQTLFDLSDFVLTLYRRHVGMSSIVVRAALSRKPLLSSDYGYLGKLVASRKLGITLDSESPATIANAFRLALEGKIVFDRSAAERLAEENTARVFAEQITDEISG